MASFTAWDLQADGSFAEAAFEYRPAGTGWEVVRDGAVVLRLGAGYRLLRVRLCGVCGTDLARRFLPFPLPQITGHEVLVDDGAGGRGLVEINASCLARGVPAPACSYCSSPRAMNRHCPDRITMGINALPGGFAPYVLAPCQAVIPVPRDVPDLAAVFCEPFSAALHAVLTTPPTPGSRVAVLGPRRLGMLLLSALAGYRAQSPSARAFTIVAVLRRDALRETALRLGADETVLSADAAPGSFDVVYDTTGNPDALPVALSLARRVVHLKSTCGQASAGQSHLTELVVDELSVLRLPAEPVQDARAMAVFAAPGVDRRRVEALFPGASVTQGPFAGSKPASARYQGFDAAVVATPAEVDLAIRPIEGVEESLLRAKGIIYVADPTKEVSPLFAALQQGLELHSSRCGDFRRGIELLADKQTQDRVQSLVSRVVHLGDETMAVAYEQAAAPAHIKVVVDPTGLLGDRKSVV